MSLYVDGKFMGNIVPGSVKIVVVGGGDSKELLEGRDFTFDDVTATITMKMEVGAMIKISYPSVPLKGRHGRRRKNQASTGKTKAQWKSSVYGPKR